MSQLLQFPNPPADAGLPKQWYRFRQSVQVPVRANADEYLGIAPYRQGTAIWIVSADRVVSRWPGQEDALEGIVNRMLESGAIAPHGAAR